MSVETVKMSSKGQIVIPQDLREELHAGAGTVFAAIASDDTIILKKIQTPSKEDLIMQLESMAKEGKQRLQKKGIKESDFSKLVEKRRKK